MMACHGISTSPDHGWARTGRASHRSSAAACTFPPAGGYSPKKAWIDNSYGVLLHGTTKNTPHCYVEWGWHVAPTLWVRGPSLADPADGHRPRGPCRDAYETGEVVRVSDVREESARWPEFAATATRAPGCGRGRRDPDAAGRQGHRDPQPLLSGLREWSDKDIAVAGVLADVATSYVVNASMLPQQEQLREHLQHALESRVVIEQAKGITAFKNAVTVDQAYRLIRRHARNNNASLRMVAEAIVAVGLQV